MNNILDYSHMIKTYIMITEFEPEINKNLLDNLCKCDNHIQCFQINEFNNCVNNKIIFENLPLFNILINSKTKIKFILPKKFKTSKIDLITFVKVLLYIIKFKDESFDFLLNKKYIKPITILSIYIIIINNYNHMQHIMFIFKSFVINIKNLLNANYLNNNENLDKLNALFKTYFKHKPEECINIMKSWDELFEKLINE
jgi:hypothetical protein